jgi:hypothetical protein
MGTPLSDFAGFVVLIVYLNASFGAYRMPPRRMMLGLLLAAVSAVLLAPKGRIGRVVLPPAATLLMILSVASYAWTYNVFAWGDSFWGEIVPAATVCLALSAMSVGRIKSAVVCSFAIMAAYALFYTATNWTSATLNVDTVFGGTVPGWRACFVHKNSLAVAGVVAIAVSLTLPSTRQLRLLLSGTWIGLTVMSRASTGLIGMFAVLVTVATLRGIQRRRREHRAVFTVVSLIAYSAAGGVMYVVSPVILGLLGKDATLTGRTEIWSLTFKYMPGHFWWGYGVGGIFSDPGREPTRSIVRQLGYLVFHPHSAYIYALTSLGLIGLSLHLLSLVHLATSGLRAIDIDGGIACCTAAVTTAVVVMGISESLFLGPWLGIALIGTTLARRAVTEAAQREPADGSIGAPVGERIVAPVGERIGHPGAVAGEADQRPGPVPAGR